MKAHDHKNFLFYKVSGQQLNTVFCHIFQISMSFFYFLAQHAASVVQSLATHAVCHHLQPTLQAREIGCWNGAQGCWTRLCQINNSSPKERGEEAE